MAKLSLTTVMAELEELGVEYINGVYENLKSVLTVRCIDKHEFLTTLFKLRKSAVCPICFQYENIGKEETKQFSPMVKKGKRILVTDNATHKTGYAIFENGIYIHGGVKATGKIEGSERIADMKQWFVSMIHLWEIDVVGLENVQYQGNAQTLIILAKLLGVLENAAFETTHKIPYVVSAATWKSFCKIKGVGRETQKENAQKHVEKTFGFVASSDLSDAICLGLYVCDLERFENEVKW